ncbi:head-tail joining protein [Bradyrhizobium valentinum]|uniref:Phage head-tail adapter protein n=1 Tax=Bradyrhizobium valentinum TaxID=1518501 RepID=A0A0R3KVG1_9BRAD|nr:hypothetical protein [Bradyrhizobium valentinum]KRQ99274.1 hypothetical protein CP49_11805 [Bradyrhizobium valentinum]
MVLADWRTLAAQIDSVVNEQFGERVLITPMKASDYAAGVRDETRPLATVVAVYIMTDEQMSNLAGDHSGSPFRERMAVATLTLSVRTVDVQAADPRHGDRVTMLDRNNQTFEINRAYPDPTGRTVIEMIRP